MIYLQYNLIIRGKQAIMSHGNITFLPAYNLQVHTGLQVLVISYYILNVSLEKSIPLV
jgi:hypothetical protein